MRIVREIQIAHVRKMYEPIELLIAKAMFFAQLVTEQARGLGMVENQPRPLWIYVGLVMIHDQPIIAVHAF